MVQKCANEFRIGKGTKEALESDCEGKCANDPQCKFYFYSNNNFCILYSKCNKHTKPFYGVGNTYDKKGNKECYAFRYFQKSFLSLVINRP